MKKRNLIIVIIVLIILVIGITIFMKNKSEDNSILGSSQSMFDSDNLIPIKKDGKWGYMSTEGKMIIEPKYSSATDFYGDYAQVTTEEENDGKFIVINKKGEELYKFKYPYDIEYLPVYNVWILDNKLYDSNLKPLISDDIEVYYLEKGYFEYEDEDKNVVGIMNWQGKSTYEYKFKSDDYINIDAEIDEDNWVNDEVYATIGIEENDVEKKAIINCKTGKVVLDFIEYDILTDDNNIFKVVERDDSDITIIYQIYIEDDQIAYKIDGEDIRFEFYYEDYKVLSIEYENEDKTEYYSLIDKKTYTRDELEDERERYEEIGTKGIKQIENFAYNIFSKDGKYGIISDGKVIIEAKYDEIEFLPYETYVYVQKTLNKQIVLLDKDNEITVYDLNNKEELFKFNAYSVYTYEDSTYIYAEDLKSGEQIVYNLISGKSMNIDNNSHIYCNTNYVMVEDKNGENTTYYNTDLEEIYKE